MEVIVGTEAAHQAELDPGLDTLPSSGLTPCPPTYSELSSRVGSQVSMETRKLEIHKYFIFFIFRKLHKACDRLWPQSHCDI